MKRAHIIAQLCAKPTKQLEEWCSDINKLSNYIRITRRTECWLWKGYGNRGKQPAFKSKFLAKLRGGGPVSRKLEEIYVRKFVLGLWDDRSTPHLRPICNNKKCVSPSHLINLGSCRTLFPYLTKTTLKLLLREYPISYISRYYGLSRYYLMKIKNEKDVQT